MKNKVLSIPLDDARGAKNVENGLSYEARVAAILNVHEIEKAPQESMILINNICACLEINVEKIKNIIAYKQAGSKKADIIMCLVFADFSMKEITISVKGVSGETQFANIKTHNFLEHIEDNHAKEGYKKFTGFEEYKQLWKAEFGHEDRNRYYNSELNKDNKKAIVKTACDKKFRENLFDNIFGDEDNKLSLILAPKNSWKIEPDNMLLINCEKVRKILTKRYEVLPFNFIDNKVFNSTESKKVICKIGKNGKLAAPVGEGSIKFANGLISIKRKGSENSIKYGFDPTDIQIISSVEMLNELQKIEM